MSKLRIPKTKVKPKDFSKLPWTEEFRTEFPTNVVGKFVEGGVEIDEMRDFLFAEKLMDFRKANLLVDAYKNEQKVVRNDNEILLEVAVPICENQCANCSRVMYKKSSSFYKSYYKSLIKDILGTREIILKKGYFVKSVCFTGNLMVFEPEEIENLMSLCAYTINEICIELSAASFVTQEKLDVLKKFSNIRFIINALTFNTITLRSINKHFEFKDVSETLKMIVANGFEMSIQLVVGLCKERDLQLSRNLKMAIELGASCIDLYACGCPKNCNKECLCDQEKIQMQRRLHEYANDFLLELGFSPYFLYCSEVSGGCFENVGFCQSKSCQYVADRALGISTVIGCGVCAESVLVKNLHKTKDYRYETTKLSEYVRKIDAIVKSKTEFFG